MSEKVRHYLEKSILELKDLKKKGLFEDNEISCIVKKRTDFEYRIAGRASTVGDFLKYIEYEINLENLRKKRRERLAKNSQRSISDWAGKKRIFMLFERALKKFSNEWEIWNQYIDYASKEKAYKVLNKIFNHVTIMYPTKVEFWLKAAKHTIEYQSELITARNIFQKGLRFNKESIELWVEYGSMEARFANKILLRRKLFGIGETNEINKITDDSNISLIEDDKYDEELKKLNKKENKLTDEEIKLLKSTDSNPVLRGDIFKAVYEEALVNVKDKERLTELFLNTIDKYTELDRNRLKMYIRDKFLENYPDTELANLMLIEAGVVAAAAFIKDTDIRDKKFIEKLKDSLNMYFNLSEHQKTDRLRNRYIMVLKDISERDEIELNLKTAIERAIEKILVS